jgi:hypothetical protein
MIPKSLHTVTVLVAIARLVFPAGEPLKAAQAAADALGYLDAPDAYGLIERAAAILSKGQK